ncbi:hypothetical protein CS347_14150 [Bordetella hinzii]|uniref:Uncharacterized protein n=1 Tax=Bordetella hinzii TaxID=103855 RepID=A0AAN1RXC5_9BORD|nr:hypothetical protein CS347_14150 [Bordetella hinzii]
MINEYSKKLDAHLERVVEYFSKVDNIKSPTKAQLAEVSIKQGFDRLESSLRLIQQMDPRYRSVDTFFDDLANLVTGHSKFESRTFEGKLSPVDFDLMDMALKSKTLIDELEGVFVKTQIRRGCLVDPE